MESHQKMEIDIQKPKVDSIKIDCSTFSLNPDSSQDIKLEVQADEVKKELLDCDMKLQYLDELQVPKVQPIDFDFNVLDFAFDNGPIKLEPQNILEPMQIKEENDEIAIQSGNELTAGNLEEFSVSQSLVPNNFQHIKCNKVKSYQKEPLFFNQWEQIQDCQLFRKFRF